MTKALISTDKAKYLDDLRMLYQQEIDAIYAIGVTWEQLKNEAKDKCAEDFDKALIARETLLEELIELKSSGIKVSSYEIEVGKLDQKLVTHGSLVRDIYGFDVYAFFNIKPPKLLKK